MARNFAQLVFLAVCVVLIFSGRKVIAMLMKKKIGARPFARQTRGFVNAAFYLLVRPQMPTALWMFQTVAMGLLLFTAVAQLLLGWFAFAALFFRILNSIVLLVSALFAFTMATMRNVMQHGAPFVLYREDRDPNTTRAFSSTVVDALVFGAIPLVLIVCNFIAI